MRKPSHTGMLGSQNKGNHAQLILGKDFAASPIGNHKHSGVEKSYERGRVFAKAYAQTFNTCEACRAAGLPMTKKGGPQGQPKDKYDYLVKEEMQRMGELALSKGLKPEQVIDEIMQIAFNSEGSFVGNDKLKVTTDHKLKALDMLAKYLGLYERDNKQKVADTKVLQIAFVGADHAEAQLLNAKAIAEAKEVSAVEGNEELERRNVEILKKIGHKE